MQDFAAIDFETANGRRSSVCSIGVVIVRGGEIVDRFYSLIQPSPNYYTYWTTEVHGLTRQYPDYEFYCAPAASRRGLDIPSHQLHLSAAACGYNMDNHHNALADAEACAWIAMKIL